MTAPSRRASWFVLSGILILAFVLTACSDGPPAAPEFQDTPQQESQAASTDTADTDTDRSAASPPAEPSTPASPALAFNSDTVWQEVFDTLSTGEQACIRDALDDESLESALATPITWEDVPEQWEVPIFACLDPETARALFVSITIAEIETEAAVTLSGEEELCLHEWAAEIDVAALVAASAADDAAAFAKFIPGLVQCVPDLMLSMMLAESGMAIEALSEDEASCLRAWVVEIDWAALMNASTADDSAAAEVAAGMFSCVPSLFVSLVIAELGADIEDLSEEEASCLREWAAEADWVALMTAYEADDSAFLPGLIDCVPELSLPALDQPEEASSAAEPGSGNADSLAEATSATVGEAVQGVLDDDRDLDVFAFEFEAGQLYQIDVELGTLSDSMATLYSGDGEWLAANDDHAGSTASRIYWEAASSGRYYVEVSGYGGDTGSYTLTVVALDITDDHSDSFAEATAATVGEAAQGALDYAGDVDVFVYELEEGQLYQIDVELGTLSDSVATLFGDNGDWKLATNDDYGDSSASRIYWEAASSGRYYVEVSGYDGDTGSYTLTVIVR